MKTLTLIVVLLSLTTASAKSAACAPCVRIDSLTQEFNALDVHSRPDRLKGDEMLRRVFAITNFYQGSTPPSSTFDQEFAALVRLVAAALPYDMETATASVLLKIIQARGLEKAYVQAEAALSNSCQKKFLSHVMKLYRCTGANCDQDKFPFQYRECVRKLRDAR